MTDNTPIWLRNSLDREEQLKAENERLKRHVEAEIDDERGMIRFPGGDEQFIVPRTLDITVQEFFDNDMPEWLKLLIEEREQHKAEIKRFSSMHDKGVEVIRQMEMNAQLQHRNYQNLLNDVLEQTRKVAEQDKEIQQLKTDAEYLQDVIDAKDEMLAWAERLVGSGPVPGMHYDPTNWLKEYRSTEYLNRDIK